MPASGLASIVFVRPGIVFEVLDIVLFVSGSCYPTRRQM
jgi:hypothetical protein